MLTEVSPLDGSQLGYNEPITFYFSQPMDRSSVEAVLFGLPDGSRTWSDDSTLIFTPNGPYAADAEITVAILTSAKAAQRDASGGPDHTDLSNGLRISSN